MIAFGQKHSYMQARHQTLDKAPPLKKRGGAGQLAIPS